MPAPPTTPAATATHNHTDSIRMVMAIHSELVLGLAITAILVAFAVALEGKRLRTA